MKASTALSWLSQGYVAVVDPEDGKTVNCARIVKEEIKRLEGEISRLNAAGEKAARQMRQLRFELSACNAECDEIRGKLASETR